MERWGWPRLYQRPPPSPHRSFAPALLTLLFQVGDSTLDNLPFGFIAVKRVEDALRSASPLHAVDFRDYPCDAGADVEDLQDHVEEGPDANRDEQCDHPGKDTIDASTHGPVLPGFKNGHAQDRYPEETYCHLQQPVQEP